MSLTDGTVLWVSLFRKDYHHSRSIVRARLEMRMNLVTVNMIHKDKSPDQRSRMHGCHCEGRLGENCHLRKSIAKWI